MAQISYGTITITDTTDLEWFYGTDLTHTSGTAVANIVGAAVGSMYLNTQTSLAYKCTAIAANGDQTWQYVGNMASGAINNIEVGGKNLLYDTNASSFTPVDGNGQKYISSANKISENALGTDWCKLPDSPISEVKYGMKFICTSTEKTVHECAFYVGGGRIPWIEGQTYTFSCWAKSESANELLHLQLNNATILPENLHTIRKSFNAANVWQKFSWTFTYVSATAQVNINSISVPNTVLYIGPSYQILNTVYICAFQLETGNIATDWSDYIKPNIIGGGRNLLHNTANIDLTDYTTKPNINGYYNDGKNFGNIEYRASTQATTEVTNNGVGIKTTQIIDDTTSTYCPYFRFGSSTNDSAFIQRASLYGLKKGKTYTFSADVECLLYSNVPSNNENLYHLGIYLYYWTGSAWSIHSNQNIIPFYYSDRYQNREGNLVQVKTPKSAHISFTFTIQENFEKIHLIIRPGNNNAGFSAQNDYIELKNIKLEEGNSATDWTSAPEDTEAIINEAQANLSDNAERLDQISNNIDQTNEKFNLFNENIGASLISLQDSLRTISDTIVIDPNETSPSITIVAGTEGSNACVRIEKDRISFNKTETVDLDGDETTTDDLAAITSEVLYISSQEEQGTIHINTAKIDKSIRIGNLEIFQYDHGIAVRRY